ncbi:MAG: hypothetical protein JW810_04640 [Sedimentisphaerales bacterium]|nr:hypothetical protein [Sedimentisphaerales bacterium]
MERQVYGRGRILAGWVCALVVLLGAGGLPAEGADPLADTDWILQVKASARAKIIGNQKIEGIGYLSFDADGTWYLMDEEDLGLGGTYVFDGQDKLQMNIEAQDIEDFFYDNLLDMMPSGLEQYLDEISVLGCSTAARLKQKNECMDLKFSLRFQVLMVVHDTEGKVHNIKLSYSIAAAGSCCQQEGGVWQVEADYRYTLKKNKAASPKTLQLYLGPLPEEGLSNGQFRLVELAGQTTEVLAEGDYIRNAAKLEFLLDFGQMELLVISLGEEAITESIYEFYLLDYREKLTATINKDNSLALNWNCAFWVVLNTSSYDSDPVGRFTLKGSS